jgi:hypothetical protein
VAIIEKAMTTPGTPTSPGRSDRWLITTCMGRVDFLRQTLPRVLAHTDWKYCLVDYSCPDRCGEWVARHFPGECAAGRIAVASVPGKTTFHKTVALNAGARRAIAGGAKTLCFLDADTLVSPGFGACVDSGIRPGRFLITFGRSLTGFLVVPTEDFERVGGYDEGFVNWGAEDYEMRVRLRVVGRLSYVAISTGFVTSLPHDNALRVRYYAEKSLHASNRSNYSRMRSKVREWTGMDLWSLDPSVRHLCKRRARPVSPLRPKPAVRPPVHLQPKVRRAWR